MCGITGSVGKPTNPILAYNLHTNLLRETKRRGKHATGFYAIDLNRKPIFDKAPIAADAYVKQPEWKQLISGNIAMIGHARFTTNGAAHINKNNHPHVSKFENMALVHNGIIYNYNEVKDQYKNVLESECDSEIILRIIDKEKNQIEGIKKTYELLGSGGDFACELIHVDQKSGKTTFYFFRDNGRPGVMIDAREMLGQLIFCSEEEIWKDAVHKSGMPRNVRQLAVHEVPEYKILSIDADSLKVKEIKVEKPKFKRNRNKYSSSLNNYNYYSNHSNYYNNHSSNYYDSYYNNYHDSINDNEFRSYEPTFKKSVLGNGWTETVDQKTGLPKFVFDPNYEETEYHSKEEKTHKTISEENQDQEFKELLLRCVKDKQERYPGWQDDAYSCDLITEEQWIKFSDEEIEDSEDVLDHIEDIDYEHISDYSTLYQNNDDEFLEKLSNRQTVDGNECLDCF